MRTAFARREFALDPLCAHETEVGRASYGSETRRAALTECSPFAVDYDDAKPAFAGDFEGTAASFTVNEEKSATLRRRRETRR